MGAPADSMDTWVTTLDGLRSHLTRCGMKAVHTLDIKFM